MAARLDVDDAAELSPGGRLARIRVRGASPVRLSSAATTGTMSWSTAELSTLDLTLLDPDLDVLRSGIFAVGAPVRYAGYPLLVTTLEVNGDQGVPALQIEARTAGATRARRTKGELTRRGLSPTEWVRLGAAGAGCEFVGEPSPKRRSITRAGVHQDQPAESEYDVWQRLAGELGFICFESAGVVYFARPSWLVAHLERVPVRWAPDGAGDRRVLSTPRCRRTRDDDVQPVTIDVELDDSLAYELLPGVCLDLAGIPTFGGHYVVTQCTVPLDDVSPAQVTAGSPVDPDPNPPPKADGGIARASKMVAEALTQVGHGNPTPPDANPASTSKPDRDIDGGELVAWAAARAGATGVNTTPAGLYSQADSAGLVISLERAHGLRGALLFKSGVVGISLGDGRAIAPSGDHYAIVSGSHGWTAGARCYHLEY